MSQIQEAADNIKAFASRVRGFLDVAEALEKIGNLDQAEREARKKTEAAVQAANDAESDLNSKLEKVASADDDINYAKKSADEIIANANSRSMTIIDEAGVAANEAVRMAASKKEALEQDIAALAKKSDEILSFIADKENELSSVLANIEAAKEKVASLFK